MDIAKLLVKMGMYSFDVGSDVANGVHFLKTDDYSDGKTIYDANFKDPFFQDETQLYNMSYGFAQDQNTTPDKVWGALTLTLIFVPGVVWGFVSGIGSITADWRNPKAWMTAFYEIAMGAFVPIWFPFFFMFSIVRVALNKEEDDHSEKYITALSGMEASLEALPQLVLQLHTILNGHSTTIPQFIAIVSSFVSITTASIISDIKFGSEKGGKETKLRTKIKLFMTKMPCYMTTIIFRGLALTLTISFLRTNALTSIIILFAELVFVCYIRINKSDADIEEKTVNFWILVFTNVGCMNAYANGADVSRIEEYNKDVASFIKWSAIVTTLHHFIVLIFILTMGSVDPGLFPHWESKEFLLKPSQDYFYYTIGFTIALGIGSVILLYFRARHIAAIEDESFH